MNNEEPPNFKGNLPEKDNPDLYLAAIHHIDELEETGRINYEQLFATARRLQDGKQ